MPRGQSTAAKKAEAYASKNPDIKAEVLAKKFGLNPSTVYRAPWWKNRRATNQPAGAANVPGNP